MNYIKSKLKNYINILKNGNDVIYDKINLSNITKIILLSIFIILFEICNIFSYINSDTKKIYYIISILFIIFSIISIIYIYSIYRNRKKLSSISILKFINTYYIIFLFICTILISSDLVFQNSIINFLFYSIIICICSPYLLKDYLLLILPITVYTIALGIVVNINYVLILYILLFSVFSVVISQIIYLFKYNHFEIITKLKKENHKLYHSLEYDKLTKLFNRYGHNNRIEELLNCIINDKKTVSIFMIDIDYFKKINDSEGHQQGDIVLSSVAGVIKNITDTKFSKVKFISRYGGEEFFAMAIDVDYSETKKIAETFRKSVENLRIDRKYKKVSEYVTISVGACFGNIKSRQELEDMIFVSDKALYKSKEAGRNRATTYRFNRKLKNKFK